MADKDEPEEKKSILLVTLGIVIAAFLNGQGLEEDEDEDETRTEQPRRR
ncbi:hypothetical protein NV379_14825 [Paenibacillus sp. N1-5-1-14]|nr:hypothetical protein [Paenibacillus radicibacter]MCR8643927.1 hypothetical protein [Paenibacillus radicibacter]